MLGRNTQDDMCKTANRVPSTQISTQGWGYCAVDDKSQKAVNGKDGRKISWRNNPGPDQAKIKILTFLLQKMGSD